MNDKLESGSTSKLGARDERSVGFGLRFAAACGRTASPPGSSVDGLAVVHAGNELP